MKKIILLLLSVGTLFATDFNLTQPTADLRGFYMDRSFDGTAPHARSLNVGGIIKEKAHLGDAVATVAWYGSYQVTGMYSEQEAIGTSLVKPDGGDIGFVGEANIAMYGFSLGRQRLSTPLMNDHDLRMLPAVYEAYNYTTDSHYGFKTQVGLVTRYTGFCSKLDKFSAPATWGDDGLSYIYVTGNGLNAQWVHANDTTGSLIKNFGYLDYSHKVGSVTLQGQVGSNDYNNRKDSMMAGVKASTDIGMFTVSILGNKIYGNNWKAIESGAMYTDWMQGYGDYTPSEAYGAQIGTTINGVMLKIGAVNVESDLSDDFVEYQFDGAYTFNTHNKLRVRYSEKDQSIHSNKADRNDLRIIYDLSF